MPKKYTFTGDICHPGKVTVIAEDIEEAEMKLGTGEFTVFDEQNDCLAFTPCGDDPEVEDADA